MPLSLSNVDSSTGATADLSLMTVQTCRRVCNSVPLSLSNVDSSTGATADLSLMTVQTDALPCHIHLPVGL